MSLPPSFLYLKIRGDDDSGFGLWLPLFLLWPLIFIMLALAFLFSALADVILAATRAPYHSFTQLLYQAVLTTLEIKGLRVNIHNPEHNVNIVVI